LKPRKFQYHAPASVDEAVDLLAEHADEAKVLAGGQSLVPLMSLRLATFGHLIDLNGIDTLAGISRSNGHVEIGALTRQSTAEHDATVAAGAPLVARALPHIGHFQIRNRGTVGGSIAHADPASELPAVALALDATLDATGPAGRREIAARDFFEGTWQTSLADDEVLTGVRFPVWSGASGFAVEEVTRRHGDFALCGAVVGVTLDGDSVTRAAIGLFGVGSTPVRASSAEQALLADGAHADLGAIGREAAEPLEPSDDLHASATYRKHVAAVVVRRALTKAIEEARS
jgi:carbon-monoxide dehydrogenase medium subunit